MIRCATAVVTSSRLRPGWAMVSGRRQYAVQVPLLPAPCCFLSLPPQGRLGHDAADDHQQGRASRSWGLVMVKDP